MRDLHQKSAAEKKKHENSEFDQEKGVTYENSNATQLISKREPGDLPHKAFHKYEP